MIQMKWRADSENSLKLYKLKRQVISHCKSANQQRRLGTYRSSCFEEGGAPHLYIAIIEVILVYLVGTISDMILYSK